MIYLISLLIFYIQVCSASFYRHRFATSSYDKKSQCWI